MQTRCVILLMVIAALMFISQPAIADDLADLKATHQRLNQAWNTGDLDTFYEIWQDGGIYLPFSQAFPVVTNTARGRPMFARWLETHLVQSQWYKVDYRVIGDTGLVWGVTTNTTIVKATGTGKRTFCKETLVFVKSNGKWIGVMAHSTPIPSEVDLY